MQLSIAGMAAYTLFCLSLLGPGHGLRSSSAGAGLEALVWMFPASAGAERASTDEAQHKLSISAGFDPAGQEATVANDTSGWEDWDSAATEWAVRHRGVACFALLSVAAVAVLCYRLGWLYILAVGCLFMACGPCLILVNNYVMNSLNFQYPITLCAMGVVSSSIFSRIAVLLGLADISKNAAATMRGAGWFKVALPIGVLKSVALATGMALYLHLGVGIIQMFKAMSPVAVLFAQRALNPSLLPSLPAVGCAGVIIAGTLLQVKGEVSFTLTGLALVVATEMSEATSVVMAEILFRTNRLTVMETVYFVAPATSLSMGCMAAVLEWPRLYEHGATPTVTEYPGLIAVCAVLGIVVNFLSWLMVQATSALTVKILAPVRSIALVSFSVVVYHEVVSTLSCAGYMISLLGFAGYNYVQMNADMALRGKFRERSSADQQAIAMRHQCIESCPDVRT